MLFREVESKIKEHSSQLEQKTDKNTTQNIQTQLNNLVLGAVGDGNNAEVIQARGSYDLLNTRLDTIEIATTDYSNRFIDITIDNVNNILIPNENSTFIGNVFTQKGIFNGLKGFKNGSKYKIAIRPKTEGYYTIKTLYHGSWINIFFEGKYLKANEEIIIDLNNSWEENKLLCLFAGDGNGEYNFEIYLYDITSVRADLLPLIDFSNSSGVVKFAQITLPKEGVKNQALSKNCVKENNIDNFSVSIQKIKSRFNNKFGSFLGDSLTADGSGGHYIAFLNEILGFSGVKNCGIGGTRVSGEGNECFWQDFRVNELDKRSRFVNIMGGTNDAPYTTVSESDFTITNCNTDNFVGAYNVLISKIYYKYLKQSVGYYSSSGISYTGVTQVDTPINIEIILVTPPKRFDTVDNLKKVEQFAEYVKKIGKMWGLRVVDSNSLMGMNDMNKDLYTTNADRLHFNKDAHKLLADVWIEEVV